MGRAEKKAAKAAKKAAGEAPRRIPVRRRRRRRRRSAAGAEERQGDARSSCCGEGGLGAQVDRIKGAIGAGKDSAADQSEALKRKIEETRERLRSQMDAGGNGVGGEDACGRPGRHAGPAI